MRDARPSSARRASAGLMIVVLVAACATGPTARPSPTASASSSSEPSPRPTAIASEAVTDLAGTWTEGSLMSLPRAEVAATVLDGRLYVAGGIDAHGNSLTTFEAFDPASNAWTALAPLPEARDHVGLAALGGRIYLAGGADFGEPAVKRDLWVYDPVSNAWTALTPMPARRWAHVLLPLGDKLCVFGGVVAAEPANNDTWIYDPATDHWDTSGAPLPTYREHLSGVVVDGKAWIIGGRHFANLGNVDVYDPASNSWSAMPDLPTPRGGLTAALLGRQIHVSGGENLENLSVFGQHEVFDLDQRRWLTAPELPNKRHGLGSGAIDGRWIVAAGGRHGGVAVSPFVDVFTPAN